MWRRRVAAWIDQVPGGPPELVDVPVELGGRVGDGTPVLPVAEAADRRRVLPGRELGDEQLSLAGARVIGARLPQAAERVGDDVRAPDDGGQAECFCPPGFLDHLGEVRRHRGQADEIVVLGVVADLLTHPVEHAHRVPLPQERRRQIAEPQMRRDDMRVVRRADEQDPHA